MLKSLKFSNFKSYSKDNEFFLDLQLEDGLEVDDKYYFQVKNIRISRFISFYGANASGKTNIIHAIRNYIIYLDNIHQIIHNEDKDFFKGYFDSNFSPYDTFLKKEGNSKFEFEFYNNETGEFFKYICEIDSEGISEESLGVMKKDYVKDNYEKVFSRSSENIVFYDEYKNNEDLVNKYIVTNTDNRKNLPVATILTFFNDNLDSFVSIFKQFIFIDDNNRKGIRFDRHIYKGNGLKSTYLNWVKLADSEINDITRNSDTGSIDFDYNGIKLNKFDLSSGTRKIIKMAPDIQDVIDNNALLLVDEFEQHFHPYLVSEILKSILENSKSSQIIMTSHDSTIIDMLPNVPKDLIYLVFKQNAESLIVKLVDYLKENKIEYKNKRFSNIFCEISNGLVTSIPTWIYKDYHKK